MRGKGGRPVPPASTAGPVLNGKALEPTTDSASTGAATSAESGAPRSGDGGAGASRPVSRGSGPGGSLIGGVDEIAEAGLLEQGQRLGEGVAPGGDLLLEIAQVVVVFEYHRADERQLPALG